MVEFFRNQGYPNCILQDNIRKVKRISRRTLLEPYDRDVEKNKGRIIFPITYHPANSKVVKIVKDNIKLLGDDEEVGDLFQEQPMVAFRRHKNLRDELVLSLIHI